MNIKHLLSASILSLMLTQMSCTSQAGEGTPQQDEKTAKEVCIQLYSVRDLLKDNTQLEQVGNAKDNAEAHRTPFPSCRAMESPTTIPDETIQHPHTISCHIGDVVRKATNLEHQPNDKSRYKRIANPYNTKLDSLFK